MAIGRSLDIRHRVLHQAEEMCAEAVNMIKVMRMCSRALRDVNRKQVKALDAEGSRQLLADAQAKKHLLQQRLDVEQASVNELEHRIQQLLRREDNMHCIEARSRKHDAEVTQAPSRSCQPSLFSPSSGRLLYRQTASAEAPLARRRDTRQC
jgi:hypothetical protein